MSATRGQGAKTLAAEWASFERKVIPNVSLVQKTEMRRAFYAGAASFMVALVEGVAPVVDGDDTPTELDMAHMFNLQKELNDFADMILSRKA